MIGSMGTAVFIITFFLLGGIAFTIAIPEIWLGQIWIVVALALGVFFFFLARRQAGMERIRKEGIRGTAHILGGEQTGAQVNDQPVMKLKLRVEASGVAPFEVVKKAIVPIFSVGALGSGRPLPVYFMRDKPHELVIDWDEAMATAATLPQGGATASTGGGTPVYVGGGDPDAQGAVADALKKHGIAPEGTIDLRENQAARADVLKALKEQGIDVAHAEAAANPETTVQGQQSSANTLDRLQKLMELKNAQLITDEEFSEHKERILKDV